MVPIVEQAATQLEPDVRLVKVDGDAVPEIAAEAERCKADLIVMGGHGHFPA
jgi:nucleotide-binding universal stress UspA family protein